MKFKVREGFLADVTEVIDLGNGNTQTQVQTFYGGKVVDLTAEQAREHAHKLEPVDKEATKFLESLHVAGPAAGVQVDIDALVAAKVSDQLEAAVAKAVAAALAGSKAPS